MRLPSAPLCFAASLPPSASQGCVAARLVATSIQATWSTDRPRRPIVVASTPDANACIASATYASILSCCRRLHSISALALHHIAPSSSTPPRPIDQETNRRGTRPTLHVLAAIIPPPRSYKNGPVMVGIMLYLVEVASGESWAEPAQVEIRPYLADSAETPGRAKLGIPHRSR